MADARGGGRTRPRGAAKIKVQGVTTQSKHAATTKPSSQNTVLPKLKLTNNNHNEQSSPTAPFSPRAHEIPLVLPVAPHAPNMNTAVRPIAPSFRPAPPLAGSREELGAKTAWTTPRNPDPEIPETSEPPSNSRSSPALDAFFHVDGSSVQTPARLLAVEETLLATEQQYQIDWAKLQADADKFLEISSTATQHLEDIQAELPVLASTSVRTRSALSDLSKEVETLHGHYDAEKDKALASFERTLTQRDEDRAALVAAHASEKKGLEEMYDDEITSLKADFRQRIEEIEERAAAMEAVSLQEIAALKQTMATTLQGQQEQSKAEHEALERRSHDELHELRTKSQAELINMRETSEASYHQLLTSSQQEICDLKSTSAAEIERLLEVSASSLAEITDKLTSELAEAKEHTANTISTLTTDHATQLTQLERARSDEIAQLQHRHDQEYRSLQEERDQQVRELGKRLEAAKAAHGLQIEQLSARFAAELSATTAMLTGKSNTLVQHHAREVHELRSKHANEATELVASYDGQLAALKLNHAEQLRAAETEASTSCEALVQQYEAQLRTVQDDATREKDRLVLRYESDLEFLRRSTAEQMESITAEREDAIQQLREAHAARVLALETTMRENDKRQSEAMTQLEEELEDKKARIVALENTEEDLRQQNGMLVERNQEEIARWSMQREEIMTAVAQVERECAARNDTIELLKRELRVSEDGNHTKSNTLLELTFVVKSRDEEIEKLHAALLDTIQNVNSKTEILELTAETLSSKTKELEDTRTALRMESGRLSRVEEDVQVKTGMLEDSELKIESMRLQMETLRLEMKRLQMDMRLQHEHSAGEMELKQGEIRRLHAAQTELKQKNDIHQESIVRLEASLAEAQRQSDDLRRRMELLKLETGQHLDDARKLRDELMEKEKENSMVAKEAQNLHNENLKLQIRFNNSLTHAQTQREKLACCEMLIEDIHCQYQRRMEMTAAEKDARLRHEKHLLQLELSTVKDTLRRYEDVESKLDDSQALCESRQAHIEKLVGEREQLESRLKVLEEEGTRLDAEKTTAIEDLTQEREQLKKQLEERVQCVKNLEAMIAETRQELDARDALVASVSSDASSLSRILQEKDELIAGTQQRLDEVMQEKGSTSQEIALLRDQVVHIEHLCREKDEEIATLERAFHCESEAHLRDVKDAEEQLVAAESALEDERRQKAIDDRSHEEAKLQIQHLASSLEAVDDRFASEKLSYDQTLAEATLQIQFLVKAVKSTEEALGVCRSQLEQVRTEKTLQEDEVSFQIQYMVAALKDQEDTLAKVRQQLSEATAQLQEHERDAGVKAALAVEVQRQEVETLKRDLEALVVTHSAQIQQLQEAKQQELDQLSADTSKASEAAIVVAQKASNEELAALRAEHARLMTAAAEAFRAQNMDSEARLAAAVTQGDEAAKKYSEANAQCQELSHRLVELQQQLKDTERSLAETQEVVRVRKATVESVRKEMALMMEMHKHTAVDNADGKNSGSGRSLEYACQLLKQQLETFVNEEFHVEVPHVELTTEEDLLAHLKDAVRMRYCLSVIGSPRSLTSDCACEALRTLQRIAYVAVGDVDLTAETLETVENSVAGHVRDLTTLVKQLQDYLDVGGVPTIEWALQVYAPVFSLLKDLPLSQGSASVHEARVASLLAVVSDHSAMRASVDALLSHSRTTLETDRFQSLEDLQPLVDEASFLRSRVRAHSNEGFSVDANESEPATNMLLTSELQVLLNERHLLLAELVRALEWQDYTTSRSQSVLIVDAVRELMRIVHAFESLSFSHRHNDLSEPLSLAQRAQAIVAFVDELRLITQFAQNILDEEADATTTSAADQSHSSSASSLLSVPSIKTRTPTPTHDRPDANGADTTFQSASQESLTPLENGIETLSPDRDLESDLLLSGDALAPVDDNDHLRPSLSGALSESLLDISLVMNDHHRILSEAAHWVGKARSMSPRHKRKNQGSGSFDFTAELSQIVRDHCALLSLGRKLFRLQDPRQDLPSVLECLAVLSRLTERLSFFDVSMRASDSIESLGSNGESKSELSVQHERLKALLSVFASMETIARHLQDYDGFVGRVIPTHFSSTGSAESIGNVELLSKAIVERLAMIEQLRASLGPTTVVEELPVFVESIQRLAAEAIAERTSSEDKSNASSAGAIVAAVGRAFRDRKSLSVMLERMRETLLFSSTAETPEELMDQLNETLSQCATLIQDKENAWKTVENLTGQLAAIDEQHAEEARVLEEVEAVGDCTRTERIASLVEQLKTLRHQNELMVASITAESELLQDVWPHVESSADDESSQLDSRVAAVRTLVEAKEALAQSKNALAGKLHEAEAHLRTTTMEFEAKLAESDAQLREAEAAFEERFHDAQGVFETELRAQKSAFEAKHSETERNLEAQRLDAESHFETKLRALEDRTAAARKQIADAVEEEKEYLSDRGIEWIEHETRTDIYDRLLGDCDAYKRHAQRVQNELKEEAAFLQEHGMRLVTTDADVHASRMAVLKALFERQRVLIDEKMEREIADQQERVRLEAEGIHVPDRNAMVSRLIELVQQVKDLVSEASAQLTRRDEVWAQERAFLLAHGITDIQVSPSDSRMGVYEVLLQRVEAAKQTLVAWEGSPHADALGCRQADALRETDRQKLEMEFANATAKAVASALEKQAQQLDFRRAALAAGDSAMSSLAASPPNQSARSFIEAFTTRDHAAVSMIYRLIRLTTDVLNTSAFSSNSNGGGGVPVDLTQAVMTCVKELKALKEYLLQTLEQITNDSGAFTLEQPLLAATRESVTDRDAAIDFAWLLHRAFVVQADKLVQEKCNVVTTTIQKLSESLATHTSDFSHAEAKCMSMEMRLAQETAQLAALEAKYQTQETFVERFVDERRQIEVALTKALDDAKQERTVLLAKMDALEAEKSEAVALVNANGLASSSSGGMTPRTPMSSHGRMYASVVPTRPDKPRELTSSRLKTGIPSTTGTVHKERFVSDLEKETGQRRSANTHTSMTARRANEWKRHELLTSSTQIEQQFRAMSESPNVLSLSPDAPVKDRSLSDQELWYQGVRLLQHVSFFVSVFFVPKQKTFRVEVFNSDSEQQQTIYVTLDEMQGFLHESKRAAKNGLTLDDPARHSEVADMLFERVKILGGDASNLLIAFQ